MYASRSGPGFSRCDVPLLYIRYKVEVDAKAEGLSYPFPRRPGCPVERGVMFLPYIIRYKVEVDAEVGLFPTKTQALYQSARLIS